MRKTILAFSTLAALGAFAAPTVSYTTATNIAKAVHAQEMADVRRIVRIAPYLYEMEIDAETPADWKKWYDTFGPAEIGGCLSFRAHGFHARNYDWKFDKTAEVVVHVPATATRRASVGVANVSTNLTDEMVSHGVPSWFYRVLPGRMMDGINDAGVAISVNVVHAKGNEADLWPGREMSAMGVVRYVLDNHTNAFDAAKWIVEKVYIPAKFVDQTGYSFHWMVSDERETYIVEDGAMHLIVDPADGGGEHWYFDPVMSNYRLYSSASSGASFARNVVGSYDPYGCGIERSDAVRAGLSGVTDAVSAMDLLKRAWYSNAYPSHPAADPFWYTEFTSAEAGLTMLAPDEKLRELADLADVFYIKDHSTASATYRTGISWQTVHSSVYDITNRTLAVRVQEDNKIYNFSLLNSGGTGGADEDEVKRIIAEIPVGEYPAPAVSSILERVTNEDVHITVTDDTLTIWDTTNAVWSCNSSDKIKLVVSGGVLSILDGPDVVWSSGGGSGGGGIKTNDVINIVQPRIAGAAQNGTNYTDVATNVVMRDVTEKTESLKEIVYTWEQFLDGSNVVFSITNYISGTYNLGAAKLKINELKDIGGGEKFYVTVYDSRDEIILHQTNFNATVVQPGFTNMANRIEATSNWVDRAKSPMAWGTVASDGTEAPSNTVVISAPSTVFAGGHAFERVNVGTGTVGILVSKGAAAYTGEPGTFRFLDALTGEYFGYVKNTYTLGLNTDDIQVDTATHMVTLTYHVTMSGYPVIMYLPDLEDYGPEEWEPLNDVTGDPIPGASHAVLWEDPDPEPGTKVCHINCTEGQGFFTANIAGVSGDCKFETNMAADIKGGIIAFDAADTNVAFAVEAYVDGGEVKWRVKD